MRPLSESLTIYISFHVLTPRTELMETDEMRHMIFRLVGIPLIVVGLKIIKYVENLVRISRQKSFRGPTYH